MLVLSHYQAQEILTARAAGTAGMELSLDLGLSLMSVFLESQGIRLPDGGSLSWESLAAIAEDENGCYLLEQIPLGRIPPSPRVWEGEINGNTQISDLYPSSRPIFGGEKGGTQRSCVLGDERGNLHACEIQATGVSGICVPRKIHLYSELTGRVYSLYPTSGAPTMLVSGLPMHRIKDTDPYHDTLEKVKATRPVGNVLDTCTGLGYTAIEASKHANVAHVTTIELDPAALQICRDNPWSQALFDNPKITQIIGDSFDEIASFPDGAFTRIIHDPPYFSLAGDLYSLEFYRQACRVLSRNGRLFHYIGDPQSKSGRSATAGVIKRLEQAGFRHIERAPRAFGVVASK